QTPVGEAELLRAGDQVAGLGEGMAGAQMVEGVLDHPGRVLGVPRSWQGVGQAGGPLPDLHADRPVLPCGLLPADALLDQSSAARRSIRQVELNQRVLSSLEGQLQLVADRGRTDE